MTRYFFNLPPLPDIETVDAAAKFLDGHGVAGYAAIDGLRACVEIDQTVAEILDRASAQVEMRAGMLEEIAETMKIIVDNLR